VSAEDADATLLLRDARRGGAQPARRLEEVTYEALRDLARRRLARERADHTLSATALAHEAYLRLIDQERAEPRDRSHFLAIAALAMRRVLVDHARRRGAGKRGAGAQRVTLDEGRAALEVDLERALEVERAIAAFEGHSPRACRALVCRIFGGMTDAEISEELGVSIPTIRRDVRFARAWLTRELTRAAL
jgi:RNA polymerase sigma factor (TIGR02999 family)